MKRTACGCVLGLLSIVAAFQGCVKPDDFDPSIIARYQREMAEYSPSRRLGGRTDPGVLEPAAREGLAPLRVEEIKDADGKVVRRVIRLSLEEAIVRTLAGSPAIQLVSFDPAISREDMVQAAAAFDVVVFGTTSYAKSDNKRYATALRPITDERNFNVGLRQLLPTGTRWEMTWGATREWDNAQTLTSPTKFEPTVGLQVTQPLLRGGWLDFNLGRLRIARLAYKSQMQAFRSEVEGAITNVYRLYWQLHQAVKELEIQKSLVIWSVETVRVVEGRKGIDAGIVQIKQAESALASHRGTLVRLEKLIYDVQEQLGVLLGDPQINSLGKFEIIPTTPFVDGPVVINVADQLAAALKHNPTLAQGRLAVQAAGVQIKVAKNDLLPRLDLTASAGLQGMAGSGHVAGRELISGDYPSYTIGLEFEYPLGNRDKNSLLRARRLDRSKAIANFQQSADQIAASVKERVRQIGMTLKTLAYQRLAVAAYKAELDGLEILQKTRRGGMDPEFLELKLRSRERLSEAERAELQALVDYNSALIELRRITGTVLDLPGLKVSLP
ncbi:MAG: TolC family protein [Phycisphaerae bacterium]|jgi:outer membrane protein TolC|nr:TolC family protein [Phycisphaerae bacterium]